MKNYDGYNMKLSYHLLKQTFAEGKCVVPCLKDSDDNDDEDSQVNEFRIVIYHAASMI